MRFAHMLLFACPDCSSPIVASLVTAKRNLEDVDSDYILLQCGQCKESFNLPAFSAKRHYVEAWDGQTVVGPKPLLVTHQLALFDNQADSE